MPSSPDPSLLLPCFALVALLFLHQLFVSRPRTKGGSRGPPVVTTSPVSKLPVVGTILEFGQSPVKMVRRCYEEYGPVFTVPVRRCRCCCAVAIIRHGNRSVTGPRGGRGEDGGNDEKK